MISTRLRIRWVLCAMGLLAQTATACADDAGLPPAQESVMKEAISIAKQSDMAAAIEYLESRGDDKQVAANFSQMVRNLYFKEKDVPRMILFARAGIGFCLAHSRILRKNDAAAAQDFTGTAKTIAYNLGANTWPGWQDKGISISPTDLAIGLDAAKTNLRLGRQLKRNDTVLGNAHWLIGAHLLAAKKYAESRKAFQLSAKRFRTAKKPTYVLMAEAYSAMSQSAENPQDRMAAKKLDAAIAKLDKLQSNDGSTFAKQLKSVKPLFVKRQR